MDETYKTLHLWPRCPGGKKNAMQSTESRLWTLVNNSSVIVIWIGCYGDKVRILCVEGQGIGYDFIQDKINWEDKYGLTYSLVTQYCFGL